MQTIEAVAITGRGKFSHMTLDEYADHIRTIHGVLSGEVTHALSQQRAAKEAAAYEYWHKRLASVSERLKEIKRIARHYSIRVA